MAHGQLRVLHALDVARTQLYHFMAIVIAGMGFFTDAYDFFAISLVMDLIGYHYYHGDTPRGVSAAINGIALCGAVLGQLVFGHSSTTSWRSSAAMAYLDITFYSMNLFMKEIFTNVGLIRTRDGDNPFKRMINVTALHTVIALCGTLPGYFFTVAFVDRIGRVRIQLLGFTMMSVFIVCLAGPYDQYWTEHKRGFAVMYGMTTFLANFGPNTTTFIIAAEIFPARLRSTCHGISEAFGKIGAIIGVFGFGLVLHAEEHVRTILFVLVGCNLVGLVFTHLLPVSKGMTLEQITGEMEEQEPQLDAAAVAAAECVHEVPV
ncbi:putative inorganic phosphate transporter 1-13 [Panicum virgatum]|uniref:putative inorganic phosphate transporter 1-13 n=1 Tax=Panicum virgatum TaxID=38727 RepID=UPI0019D5F833|nr:putative inorganic phosphate transporter 1-13 [Panicum virgatum]